MIRKMGGHVSLPIAILSIIRGILTHLPTRVQTRGESSAVNQGLPGTPPQTKPAPASPHPRAATKELGHTATSDGSLSLHWSPGLPHHSRTQCQRLQVWATFRVLVTTVLCPR